MTEDANQMAGERPDGEADERARDLARRVMNLPPKPQTKPHDKPKSARALASTPEKNEPTGEAS